MSICQKWLLIDFTVNLPVLVESLMSSFVSLTVLLTLIKMPDVVNSCWLNCWISSRVAVAVRLAEMARSFASRILSVAPVIHKHCFFWKVSRRHLVNFIHRMVIHPRLRCKTIIAVSQSQHGCSPLYYWNIFWDAFSSPTLSAPILVVVPSAAKSLSYMPCYFFLHDRVSDGNGF